MSRVTDHVDISQAFVQGELLPGDGHDGKIYHSIFSPPRHDEDPLYVYRLLKPLYGMPCSQSLAHHHECFPGKRRMFHGGI